MTDDFPHDIEAVRRLAGEVTAAEASGDADAIVSVLAPDVVIMPPGRRLPG